VKKILPIVALLALGSADAANLLPNPTFSSSVNGWNVGSPGDTTDFSAAFSQSDVQASDTSGSALVTNMATRGGIGGGLWTCIPVVGNEVYTLSGFGRVPFAQATTGYGELALYFYSSNDCSGNAVEHDTTNIVSETQGGVNTWVALTSTALAPSNARSAVFYADVVKYESTGTFKVFFDNLYAGVALPGTLVVPASASIHGNAGAFFHSDLWAVDRSYTNPITVSAKYHCFPTQSCDDTTRTFVIGPREQHLETDVVGDLFRSPESAGAIELTWDTGLGHLSAVSRVYTPASSPTFGTAIPAFGEDEARTRALFLGLGANAGGTGAGFRSNAGAYNPNNGPVTVTFRLYTQGGSALGQPVTLVLGPKEPGQVNDIFTAAQAASTTTQNASLVATATAPVFFNVTVIDNRSGDSVYAAANGDEAAPAAGPPSPLASTPMTLTIPAGASHRGAAGAFFHSDVWAMNQSFSTPAGVVATYHCFGGQTCAPAPQLLVIPPRASLLLSDIIGTLFAAPDTAGAIELTYDAAAGNLAATSRVYTPSQPAPTFGAAIPGVPSTAATMRALFLGVASNGGDFSSGYRTNGGAYNPGPGPVSVVFRLYDAKGDQIGSTVTMDLAAHEPNQVNDLFAAAGAGATVTTNATLVASSTGPVFFNVTVIDNLSGDSVYAVASPDELGR
jgi:hypothetical protein